MKVVRARALKLRLTGKSYNEIGKELGVPKSTLATWLKDLVLSDKARTRLATRTRLGSAILIKRNKLQTKYAEERAKEAQKRGRMDAKRLDALGLIGAALYWAEGYKRIRVEGGKERMGHTISLVNSDAVMIAVFVRFLRETLAIPAEQIRLSMRLYAHINEDQARRHWAAAAGLSKPRFYKTTYLVSGASKGIRPYNRLPWGTLQIEVCDTHKFHYLLGLIDGVKENTKHGRVPVLPG